MTTQKKILLVEGSSDKHFFQTLCESVDAGIFPKEPVADWNRPQGGKKPILDILFNNVLKDVLKGTTSHVAVIIDADYVSDGHGYQNSLDNFTKKLNPNSAEHHYDPTPHQHESGGLYFNNNRGLKPIGLWIMPNNSSEGAFQDFIVPTISSNETPRFTHAQDVIEKLPFDGNFNTTTKLSKAQIATWMAWQKEPGLSMDWALKEKLIDSESTNMQALTSWLDFIFKA